ncbi:MAG: beta-lactamase family protein [Alphaproteobacteria bacterium]|nr:beta-lactamase family protein [Alphaproteobacteria bacterium]
MRTRRVFTIEVLLASAALALGSCGSAAEPTAEDGPPVQSTPATAGLDTAMIERVLAEASEFQNLRSLIVVRHGETLIEERFNNGPSLDQPVNIKSASKSVLSAMVGIAIERGVLRGTDQAVLSVLGDQAPSPTDRDPRLADVTVGNLLSMQAGLERTSGDNYGRWVSSPNWVRYALSRPFSAEPGGRMLYSTGSSHLLSAMLTRASGRTTRDLAQEWLGEPLGIAIPPWTQDPQGIYLGGNNMALSPRALARFGELYRTGGVVDGDRIISRDWIERSWTARTVSPWSGEQYGYGWFLSQAGDHPMRYAWGYGGQMVYVIPDLALTVVMTSETSVPRGSGYIDELHSIVTKGIVPAAEKGS